LARNSNREFCLNAEFHVIFRDLLHATNLRHGTAGFTSPPKEGVLRIFSPLKIRRLRPGMNPRTWVLEANTHPLDHRRCFSHLLHRLMFFSCYAPFLFLNFGGRKAQTLAQDTSVTPNKLTFAAQLSVHPHILFRDRLISIKFHISWFSVEDA
jgi:hypothetical protein